MNKNSKQTKRPTRAMVSKLAVGAKLFIGNKEVIGMSPMQKAAMVKSRLAANRRKKVA